MSYIFTDNMIRLRSLSWYNNTNYGSSSSSSGFVDTAGNTFTGYYYGYGYKSYIYSYSASILAYNPACYISADKTALSRDDYALPDDAISVSYSVVETATVDDDGVSTVLHVYYSNDSDEAITVNKILIVGNIATSTSNTTTGATALLFEELLDETVTIQAGERWARNFEFRLEVA